MSVKICSCTHRKEHHRVVDERRMGCKECECQQWRLAEEFIGHYPKIVTGAFKSNKIIEHLAKCGIDRRVACLYAVHVPYTGRVRIGKTMDLVYRWASRMAEWPDLFDVRPIAVVIGAQKHEEQVHGYFHDLRVYSEWFWYHDDILALGECKVPGDVTALLQEPRRSAGMIYHRNL